MNKILLFVFAAFVSLSTMAQTTITNGGFESWTGSGNTIEPTNGIQIKPGVEMPHLDHKPVFRKPQARIAELIVLELDLITLWELLLTARSQPERLRHPLLVNLMDISEPFQQIPIMQ